MDEARIRELYRQHALAQDAVHDGPLAEDILAVLSRRDWPADEHGPLDRVATSALSSDIARMMAALDQDIEQLARDVRQERAPRVVPLQRFLRRGLALAAGVGAFAVLFALVQGQGSLEPQPVPGTAQLAAEADGADVIMAVSFEAAERGQVSAAPSSQDTIFRGGFGS